MACNTDRLELSGGYPCAEKANHVVAREQTGGRVAAERRLVRHIGVAVY